MAGIANTPGQFASIWRQIDVNQKISILLVGLGSVAAVVGLVYWGGRPSYALLYSNLSRKDAAAVVAQLDTDSVPYRLEDGGTTVLVPTEQVQQARGKLVMQGVPAGGDGFEILDKGRLGMTNFAERKTYLRAVQGELARTISNVDVVEWARVHVSAPEPSVFLDRDLPASASVLIKARGGARLEPSQIASIAAFVARSVEGLDPKNITITDQFLNPLSRAIHDDGPGAATAHIEAQHEVERHLSRKVREMLDITLGPGRSSVSVCTEIQLKQETENSTEYDNDGRVAKMEKSRTSKSSGGKGGAGGVAGAASNLSTSGGAKAAGGSTESETDETMEYEVPRKEIVRVDNGVDIKRLTVSVLVAGTHKVTKDKEGKETRTYEPLPAEELSKLEEAVKQAVGFDESRKDIVKVECVEFNVPAPAVTADELAGERRWELMLRLAKHGSTVVVVLAFLLVMRSVSRRTRAAREAAAAAAAAAAPAAPRGAAQGAGAAMAAANAPLRERVASAIQDDAGSASELLKSWYETAGSAPTS